MFKLSRHARRNLSHATQKQLPMNSVVSIGLIRVDKDTVCMRRVLDTCQMRHCLGSNSNSHCQLLRAGVLPQRVKLCS